MKKLIVLAGVLVAAAGATSAQTELLLSVVPDQETATLGDIVTWTVVAELLNPDPNKTILATVAEIDFDLSFGSETGLQISNNNFLPAFDSDFFGPADDGQVVGNQIVGADGFNTVPPLNNGGGPDSSNPLMIYTFDTLITDDTPRTFGAYLSITGQFVGAYEGTEFPDVFFYQMADGSPGTVPYGFPPLLHFPTLTIVPIPAPASASLLGVGALAAFRRRR